MARDGYVARLAGELVALLGPGSGTDRDRLKQAAKLAVDFSDARVTLMAAVVLIRQREVAP